MKSARSIFLVKTTHIKEHGLYFFCYLLGEAYCEAALVYDGLEVRAGQSLGDCYQGFDKYSVSGLPMPLPDKPLIVLMSDTHVTLTWKPALPLGPNLAPYYVVEMAEYPDGDWNEVLKI